MEMNAFQHFWAIGTKSDFKFVEEIQISSSNFETEAKSKDESVGK